MKFKDLLQLSLKGFKSRKQRTIFTVLSVAVGIASILFLVSLGFGLQKNLLEQITTADSLLSFDVVSGETKVISLTTETLNEISKIPSVEKTSPHAIFASQVKLGKMTTETTLNLINEDWFLLSGITPSLGNTLSGSNEVVINSSIAELFNEKAEDMIGKYLRFTLFIQENGEFSNVTIHEAKGEFKVVGILDEEGSPPQAYLKIEDVGVPITEYQFAKVKVREASDMEDVRERLLSMGFLVSALSDTIDQANKIFNIIQIILGIFGIIALFVAAIGLVNTMTITLLERTNEIGIMRAIGASKKDIKRLFLSESTITGFLGGVTGIIIGITLSQIFNGLVNILAKTLGGKTVSLFHYPFWFLLFIIILSTVVGFLAGFWPARRASKLNPLSALRYK